MFKMWWVVILIFVVCFWVLLSGWWIMIFVFGKVKCLFFWLVVNKKLFIEVVIFNMIVWIFVLMKFMVLKIVKFVEMLLLGELMYK